MIPQFNIIYNNLFQTVHSAESEPPAEWPYLIVFDFFCSIFDDYNFVPQLADEWLTPIDISLLQEAKPNHRNKLAYQDGATP